MNNHFAKVGAWLCVAGLLLLVLALAGCSSQRPSHTERTTNADGSTNICTVYDDNLTPRASCTIEAKQ